jgi:hypothetical protein
MKLRQAAFLSFIVLSLLAAHQGDGLAVKTGRPGGGTQERKAPRDETTVARWGGVSITASQLKDYAIGRAGMAVRHGGEITPDAIRALLQEMIGRKVLKAEAGKPEVLSDPRFTGSYALASAREVANRYVSQVLREKFAVTDEEAAAEMPKRRDVVRIKQVVVPTREEAQEVLGKVRGGMSFEEAIEKYSTVKMAPGAFVEIRENYDLLDEGAREAILGLGQGDLSGVIPMKIGYGVVLAVEKRVMDDAEWNALAQERKRALFERKVTRHYENLMRDARIDLFDRELMLAAGEDFEFQTPRRAVMAVGGEKVFFDDYTRTRDVHVRDTVKARTAQDLYKAYKVEFESLAVSMTLAKVAAKEKGRTEPEGGRRDQIRDSIAMKVFGERLFDGIAASDEEVRKEYDGNPDAFTIKKRYRVRRLTFPNVAEANKFRKSVKGPEEFYRQLRQRESREDRYENTFFEWKDFDRLDEKTKKAFGKAKKGKLTEPVESGKKQQYVYFIDDIEKNYRIPFPEVRVNIKRTLLRRKQEAKLAEFVNGEKKKMDIKIFDSPIRKVAEQINKKKKHTPAP